MATARHDDESIPDAEDLYRRLAKDWIVPDTVMGGVRISSGAFSDPDREISVHLSSVIAPDDSLAYGGKGIVALAAVTAGNARSLEQAVVRDAQPNDPAHALICGLQPKKIRRKLARSARWIRCPDDQVVAAIISRSRR